MISLENGVIDSSLPPQPISISYTSVVLLPSRLMHPTLPLVVLVRHGETAWTVSGRHTGQSDIALTQAGSNGAKALHAVLNKFSFSAVLTSPLRRARQSAELAGYGDVAAIVDDLREWDYGDYEGQTTAAIRAERPDWRLFEHGCPNGETPDAMSERADRVVKRIQLVHRDSGNALIFAHSDLLRVLIARWLRLPAGEGRRFLLATSSLSILGYDHDLDEPAVRRLNQVAPDVVTSPYSTVPLLL